MSEREKNLLFVMGAVLFIIANFFLYEMVYKPKISGASARERRAERELTRAEAIKDRSKEFTRSLGWLARAEGQPTSYPIAQSQLESSVDKAAKNRGLTVRQNQILDHLEGAHYHRVRVRFKVNGTEQQILSWVMEIDNPSKLQVVTKLDLQPQRTDLSRADCEVEVSKWFIPQTEADQLL